MGIEQEMEVWQRVAAFAQSPSHDFHHIERVQAFADGLAEVLGVDAQLVRIAAILHDLGRGDDSRRHGLASIRASKEMAAEVLAHLDLTDEERETIIAAIETHDQPEVSPDSLHGRILKDADFLAGFGAWGLLRIAMWSGESGRRVDHALQRMTEGMRRRLEKLEFSASRDAALREVLYAQSFYAELQRPATIETSQFPGRYCVLEGISGAGKNTVAEAVCDALSSDGVAHCFVEEPGPHFRRIRDDLGVEGDGTLPRYIMKSLFMIDRAIQLKKDILPALINGEIVVSVRSYLSTAVYQTTDAADAYRTMMTHDWMPICDLLLLLDLDSETAAERIDSRNKAPGDFETPSQLQEYRDRYLSYAPSFTARKLSIIDASKSEKRVADEVIAAIRTCLEG